MWPFRIKASKDSLQSRKAVVIYGHRFVIRRLNPLLDFSSETMPQIFASYASRRKEDPGAQQPDSPERLRKALAEMCHVIEAGLVEPALVPVGKGEQRGHESGITVNDIIRDEDVATKLYWEIILHSLNKFKGIKGVFFSIRQRYLLWTALRSATENSHPTSSLAQESSA